MSRQHSFLQSVAAFWSKVEKTETCWFWRNDTDCHGYGQFHIDGKKMSAHQVSWMLLNGPIPAGLEMDHICRNKGCVRPDHLRAVTHQQNIRYRVCSMICKRGHPLEDPNLYYYKHYGKPVRRCLACMRLSKVKA